MVKFHRITGYFGAEVEGIDLARDTTRDVIDTIKQGLLDHKVLIFRNQQDMSPARHVAFSKEFGELDVHPFHPRVDGEVGIDLLHSKGTVAREGWHTDIGFETPPNIVTTLRAIEIPEYGRDTGFIDCEAMYDGLSEPMKRAIDGLVAVNDWRHVFRPASSEGGDVATDADSARGYVVIPDDEYQRRDRTMPVQEFPVVTTNIETGRKALNLDFTFSVRLKGMRDHESRSFLRMLFDEFHFPEYQMRASWRPGTLVMWDNRTTLHGMIWDSDFPRVMHRTVVKGDRLFPDASQAAKQPDVAQAENAL